MERKDFGTIPHAVVDSGLWAKMKPSEKSVYIVLVRYANYKSHFCFPSIERIRQEAGISKTRVCGSLQQLVVYGLITKKRAPKGLNFRNVYRVIPEPKINLAIIPQKMEKKCKGYRDKNTGKFRVRPQNVETDIGPQIVEAGRPQNVEKKERIEIERNRDSLNKPPTLTYSKETIKEFLKAGQEKRVIETLLRRGYSEDEINVLLEEVKAKPDKGNDPNTPLHLHSGSGLLKSLPKAQTKRTKKSKGRDPY